MATCAEAEDVPPGSWQDNFNEQSDEVRDLSVTALESIFEDTFNVITPAAEDGKSKFELQVMVPVHLGENGALLHTWTPYQGSDVQAPTLSAAPEQDNRPQFLRTQSGRRWHTSVHLNHLPPLELYVTFPHSYPSDTPPSFTLSCLWLDALDLSSLCRELDKLWQEQPGMPIVFMWADWLQNNTLSHLDREQGLDLVPYVPEQDGIPETRDPRALPECTEVQADLIALLRYNRQIDLQKFVQTVHECCLCFDSKLGSEFYHLSGCGHYFCVECLSGYCNMHIAEGTVQHLNCPDGSCKLGIPPGVLRELLGDEAYKRWEKFQLQKALDSMHDVIWCPRCMSAVVLEEGEHMGHCLNCIYTFCIHCESTWEPCHRCKTLEDHLAELSEDVRQAVRDELENQAAGRKTLKKAVLTQKARKILDKVATCYLSKSFITKISKPCPKCRAPIEKYAGCNKVTCSQCGTYMCWVCGKRISGYQHFSSSSCGMFPGAEPLVPAHLANRVENPAQRRVMEAINEGRATIGICPRCRQRCLKEARNNHIRCWQCKTNFCFQCAQILTGNVTLHYRAGMPCQQHSE